MTRARAALLLAFVFLAGTVCGALGTAAWIRHRTRPWGFAAERVEQTVVRRIARRLDLDAEQRRILERVASDTRGRMEEVRRQAMERVNEILDRAYDQLEPTLRPEQKEKLVRMRQEARSRFRDRGVEDRPPRGREGGRP